MKNALVSPTEQVTYISDWVLLNKRYQPVYTAVPNGQRIAEVLDQPFEVAPPLFWVECADDVVPDQFYFDSVSSQTLVTPPNVPMPVSVQPTTEGAQTL